MGKILRVAGPVVIAEEIENARMYDVVRVGELGLLGEIIGMEGSKATIQVYEDTSGIKPGQDVESTGHPLSVVLAPGILSSIYDGVQRPLDVIRAQGGDFIQRGIYPTPVDMKKKWKFTPSVKKGDKVSSGDIVGVVKETSLIDHRIMVPFGIEGTIESIEDGEFTPLQTVGTVMTKSGVKEIPLGQVWPVRQPRPVKNKLPPEIPLVTGQRVIDSFFPVAKGGTVAVPGPFGSGKCVTGDTPVLLGDGSLIEIEELYNRHEKTAKKVKEKDGEYLKVPEPIKLFSYNDNKISSSKSSLMYKGKSDSVIKIKTRTGRIVKVTPVHKLFRVDERGKIRETMASNLIIGDYILSAKKINVRNEDSKIDLYDLPELRALDEKIKKDTSELLKEAISQKIKIDLPKNARYSLTRSTRSVAPKLKWLKTIYETMGLAPPIPKQLVGDRRSSPVTIPSKITKELAEFIGYYVSEGYIRGEETIVFTNSDERLLNRFSELVSLLFGLNSRLELQGDKTPNVLVHSSVLVKLLDLLDIGRIASTKQIPQLLLSSSQESLNAFLEAYFIGDGSFYEGNVELSTASPKLRNQLSYLLTRLGIIHTSGTRTIDGTTYHRIFIRSISNLKVLSSVFVSKSNKISSIGKYIDSKVRGFNSIDIAPVSTEYIREMYRNTSYSKLIKNGIEIYNYIGNGEHMSMTTFANFAQIIEDEEGPQLNDFDKSLIESSEFVYSDEIASIEVENGPVTVYDVSVPDYGQNFVGGYGGIILHNTVVQHQLAKWSDADVIIYTACGERGNEATEVLTEFPRLTDPKTGKPLMERTTLIANTSNMPVAAREASIYTGITLAEYFRDMGYDVGLMADSTSRWAEALREISGRLEEMPGEEGYPAYLGRRIAEFYERAGNARVVSSDQRRGSVTVIGAVSPPGGDTSEPVSQNTLRVTRVFWALDASLAQRRHFPSVNWLNSYSLYSQELSKWFDKNVAEDWYSSYQKSMTILEKEAELQEVAQLVGYDALPENEKEVLDIAKSLREDFLQQSAFDEVDTYCSLKKQYLMLKSILAMDEVEKYAVSKGVTVSELDTLPFKEKLSRFKEVKESDIDKYYGDLIKD
ncbi:MAG: V-type ATP synthase subunit A, partial [Candidatus Thermoplasmatota archaeon]|nr:V-type ATP synthase subunit A [Candidatus Thermoplasmatota archaeon]